MLRRSVVVCAACWLIAVGAADAGEPARADVAEWVSQVHFEGIPFERAAALDAEGVAVLVALLRDPERERDHANALVAIGIAGGEAAYAAIAGYPLVSGEIDRDHFRALLAIPVAMGHLARADPRALAWLIDARAPRVETQRWFRHMGPERVEALWQQAVLTGLGLSGAPPAAELLAAVAAGDDRLARHAASTLEVHERIARLGPAAALRGLQHQP